ncbi:hypothetical protein M406DRAFT_255755, partial [Cryphonectria parasitica EP155]
IDDLPSTWKDSFVLSFQLRYQYIRVDFLCIIQDDPDDWTREASSMCDVYRKGDLTLAIPICDRASQSFMH